MVAHDQGDYDQALDWYRKSLAIDAELGDRTGIASSYHQLGMVAHDQGDYDQALDWYRQALRIFEELGNRPNMASTTSLIGVLLTEAGSPEDALRWSLRSLDLRAELGSPEISTDLRSLERQRALLGTQQFERMLRQTLGEDASNAVLVLLQGLQGNE
jgi:tetratricopeptide (TPR) repeat protein